MTIGLALAALVVSPAVYLLFPLLLPLDLVPHGLRKAVGPKLVTIGGRDLLRHMLQDFENAVEHANQEAKSAKEKAAGNPAAGEQASPGGSGGEPPGPVRR